MNFSQMVTSSVLLRSTAILILVVAVLSAIIVGCVELLTGQGVNPVVWSIAGTGIIQSLAVLNINFGVVLQPAPAPAPHADPPVQPALPTASTPTASA